MNPPHTNALYIHWPFCVSKCPYCDFNSHVRDRINHTDWRKALLADLAHEAQVTPHGAIGSIFFGGGTPSLMEPATVAALIDAADKHWGLDANVEITLEANPSSVEAAKFGALASSGVNRVSLGLQALDNEALHFLGRAHDVDEGLAALETAQKAFSRVNFDLIYARPGQDADAWSAELARAIALGADHMSLYQLTIESGTRFETLVKQGTFAPLDPDDAAPLYEQTQAQMDASGMPAYETSNHARAGQESRHNLTYWRYGTYFGIGPGAHGRRGGMATVRHKKPENWLSAVSRNGHGLQSEDALSLEEQAREALVMGLRLAEGVDLARITAQTGLSAADLINPRGESMLADLGLINRTGTHISVTRAGALLLDRILVELVAV
jgi:putative oxygen-independent coproporphyrinogen III oxidase